MEAVVSREGCTYIEAIAGYMYDNNLLPSKIVKMLCPILLDRIKEEVKINRMIRPSVLEIILAKDEKEVDEK